MPTRKPKISIRARKYVKNKLSGMSDTQAAIAAGYSKNTAKLASTNIENHSVKELMEDIMDRKGLTDDSLIDDLIKGLREANRIFGSGDNFVETPDYGVRHKYLETGLKIKGKLIDKKDFTSGGEKIDALVIVKYGDKPNKVAN